MTLTRLPQDEPRDWAQLMSAVAQLRDRASFMEIYDYFTPRLCIYIQGMGTSRAIAEELAQESLMRLWSHAERYDGQRGAVSTWLFRIARNLAIDRTRRHRFQALLQQRLLAENAVTEADADDYVDSLKLKRQIAALPPVQARLIRLSFFEGKSHQEISTQLQMPLGTVKSHLRRAFLRLKDDLGVRE